MQTTRTNETVDLLRDARRGGDPVAAIDRLLELGYSHDRAWRAATGRVSLRICRPADVDSKTRARISYRDALQAWQWLGGDAVVERDASKYDPYAVRVIIRLGNTVHVGWGSVGAMLESFGVKYRIAEVEIAEAA